MIESVLEVVHIDGEESHYRVDFMYVTELADASDLHELKELAIRELARKFNVQLGITQQYIDDYQTQHDEEE